METQEREFYILRGTVQRQRLDEDIDRIIQLYNDHGYMQARVETVGDRGGPGERAGHHPHRGGGRAPVQGRRGGRHRQQGPARRRRSGSASSSSRGTSSRGASSGTASPAITDLYSAIGRASADVSPNTMQDMPNRLVNIGLRGRGGPRDLRRADQHLGQHPQRGEDPAPRDPDGGGRPLHEPEAHPGQAAADQPQLLRQGRGQDRSRARPRTRSSSTST